MRLGPLKILLLSALSPALLQPAHAAQGAWHQNLGSKTRIIAAGAIDRQTLAADVAVQIELEPGWKTYWRTPGDSGIAPTLDFSASTNLADARVDWPAPTALRDEYGTAFGYKTSLVLPIRVTAKRSSLPMIVDLSMRYGICEKICVPVEQRLSLTLTGWTRADPLAANLIRTARAEVPGAAAPGDAMAVTAVVRRPDGVLAVQGRVPASHRQVELFVEGPQNWYFPAAERERRSGEDIVWTIALDGVPKDAVLAGTPLVLTMVSDQGSVEQHWQIE